MRFLSEIIQRFVTKWEDPLPIPPPAGIFEPDVIIANDKVSLQTARQMNLLAPPLRRAPDANPRVNNP
jgi:hypothetical protein